MKTDVSNKKKTFDFLSRISLKTKKGLKKKKKSSDVICLRTLYKNAESTIPKLECCQANTRALFKKFPMNSSSFFARLSPIAFVSWSCRRMLLPYVHMYFELVMKPAI